MSFYNHVFFASVTVNFDSVRVEVYNGYSRISVEVFMKQFQGFRMAFNTDNFPCSMIEEELCCLAAAGSDVENVLSTWEILAMPGF